MSLFYAFFIYFIGLITLGIETVEIPKELTLCKYGDSECIKNVINDLFTNKRSGFPELNLVSINPVHINTISISQGKESPVNIDLKFRDNLLSGPNDIQVYNVSGFNKNIEGPHEFSMKSNYITLAGPYEISGKVLILPISGVGQSNITIVDPNMKLRFFGKPVERDGKTYMQLNKTKFYLNVTRMYMTLDNLFNGDKTLGDNMNKFLNENWKDIYMELRGSITKAFSMIFEKIVQNVFDKFPYDELFIKE